MGLGLPFDLHVTGLLKQCSQRVYLLLLLRSQVSADHLSTVFVGLIISRLMYALPAWGHVCMKLYLLVKLAKLMLS